jgi:3D (Asp-Asp-Asp) domain-containing protein
MNTKTRVFIALFILISVLPSGVDANAGLFDSWKETNVEPGLRWLTGQNTKWAFENVYTRIDQTDNSTNPAIQETIVVGPQIPATPIRTKTATVREYVITATAYSSTVDQTDDTPFITASGTYVRDGIVAANFLPFGTVFKIPDLYGDKIFIVEDRMNKRYWHRVDIWFPERQMAKEFGIKQIRIEIVS